LSTNLVSAGNCGGATGCTCGDTLVESRNFLGVATDNFTNCTNHGLVVNTSNIILDCNGTQFTGLNNGYGIFLNVTTNVTIQNCDISSFARGVYFGLTNQSLVSNFNISTNTTGENAVYLYDSHYNNITNSPNITTYGAGADGVLLTESNNNNLSLSTIYMISSGRGVSLNDSTDTYISANIINATTGYGIYNVNSYHRSMIDNNRMNGSATEIMWFNGSNNITVYSNDLIGQGLRSFRYYTEHFNISSNTFSNFTGGSRDAIQIDNSQWTYIKYNTFIDGYRGINLDEASNHTELKGNTIIDMEYIGIEIDSGNNISIIQNEVNISAVYTGKGLSSTATPDNTNVTIYRNNFSTYDSSKEAADIQNMDLANISDNRFIKRNDTATVGGSTFALNDVENSTLAYNTIIFSGGGECAALDFDSTSLNNLVFRDNTIIVNANGTDTGAKGLDMTGFKTSLTFDSNTITVTGNNTYPISFRGSTDYSNMTFSSNTINQNGNGSIIQVDTNNDFVNVSFLSNTFTVTDGLAYGFFGGGGTGYSEFDFTNDIFTVPNQVDIDPGSVNLTFVNVTFDKDDVNISTGTGNLTVKWYVDTLVQSGGSNLEGAFVSVKNTSNSEVANGTTTSSGTIDRLTLQEAFVYINSSLATIWNYSTPHTINVTKTGYTYAGTTVNLSQTNSTSLTHSMTASSTTTTTTTTTTSSGGSSGSYTPTYEQTLLVQTASPDEPIQFEVTNDEIPVGNVEIEVNKELNDLKIRVERFDDKPDDVSTFSGEVYKYLFFETTRFTNADIVSGEVIFTVTKEWVTDNNIDKDMVALFWFNEDTSEWEELTTEFLRTLADEYEYKAQTSGFSYFAIGVKGEGIIPDVEEVTEDVEEITGEEPEVITGEPVEEEKSQAWKVILAIVAVIGIVGVIAYLTQKKK